MYTRLRQLKPESCKAVILEFDERFGKFGEDFIFYDYNDPVNFDENLKHSFDMVVVDPPFLSDECLRKTAETVKFLGKGNVLLCTGRFHLLRTLTIKLNFHSFITPLNSNHEM